MAKAPVRVAVTGAAGQIGYSLLFRIASGEMLGKDQPVILQMLELPIDKAQQALKGVMMELEDCAFPLLADMIGTSDPKVAFKDAQQALLVGASTTGRSVRRHSTQLIRQPAIESGWRGRQPRRPRRATRLRGVSRSRRRIPS